MHFLPQIMKPGILLGDFEGPLGTSPFLYHTLVSSLLSSLEFMRNL